MTFASALARLRGLFPRRNHGIVIFLVLLIVAAWFFPRPKASTSLSNWIDFYHSSATTYTPSRPPPTYGIDLSRPDAPFIDWPLKRVCDEANSVPGLVFVCDNNSGGIGNVRNYIQTCFRYGIEAGATGFILPRIRQRNQDDLADLFTNFLPFDYMFDEGHFRRSFNTSCPNITIYDHPKDVLGADGVNPLLEVVTPKLFGDREGCDERDQNRHTHQFGDQFRTWLHNSTYGHLPNTTHPRLIRLKWGVLWDWPIYYDGPEFAATFGNILKFNQTLLRLGDAVTKAMHKFARSDVGEKKGRFLGVHLRTESDAMDFWPTYETQVGCYLYHAQRDQYKAAYLATGDATEASRFGKEAAELANLTVVTKTDLLKGKQLAELQSLTWDQQAIVDFVALLDSEYFVGAMPSSFSVYLTMKRHLRTGGLYTRPYKVGSGGDGLSYLVGDYRKYWDGWLFMFDGMWP